MVWGDKKARGSFAHHLQPRQKKTKPNQALTELFPHDTAFPRICTKPALQKSRRCTKELSVTHQILRKQLFYPATRTLRVDVSRPHRTAPNRTPLPPRPPLPLLPTGLRALRSTALSSTAAIKGFHPAPFNPSVLLSQNKTCAICLFCVPSPPPPPFKAARRGPGAAQPYLPDLVMIISVPSSWNLSQSSLVSRLQEILAISSLGMMGVVGMRGSVHKDEGLVLKSPWGSRLDKSLRGWAQEDFSTNCSAEC